VRIRASSIAIGVLALSGLAAYGVHFYRENQRSAELTRTVDRLVEQREAETPAMVASATGLLTCTLMIRYDKSEAIERVSDEELRGMIEGETVKTLSEMSVPLPENSIKALVDANIARGIETNCGLPHPLLRYWRPPSP
jgi:hypothetical protein